jgi:hypothetical protein
MKKKLEKKYTFILKNVNTEKVEQRFGIVIISNINVIPSKLPKNSTKISDLTLNKNQEVISFLDEAKKSHKCTVSMIDFNTNTELTFDKNSCCFWDRNVIPKNIIPIGCPIKYIPSQAIKSYYSEISKDKYVIKENITFKRQNKIENVQDLRLDINDRNYYITDGIFCSFNCCMAYISHNKKESIYNISEMLLLKMYTDIYPDHPPSIIEEAPHWRKLKEYGGDLCIEDFRDSFNKIEYKNHGFIVPKFKSLGILFEEKLKF